MISSKRILLYTTSPKETVGGMEVVFASLADGLRRRGHRVDLLYEGDVVSREVRDGIDVWTVPLERPQTRHKVPTVASTLACVGSVRRLAAILREVRPDIVNVHYADTTAFYFALLRTVFGYRLVVSAHGSDLLRPFGPVQRLVVPRVLRRADAVVTVSEALTERAAALGVCAHTILNGVDYGFWSAHPRQMDRPPVVVNVGRLHPVKGQDVLLRAFAVISERVPEARLWFVGNGGERGVLEELARRYGISDRVHFLGELGREEVRATLARAALFVLPSRSEGLPLALLEAMAVGLPAVATDVGGVAEVIRSAEEGRLVPPNDIDALAAALGAMLADPARLHALSEASRMRARAFSFSASVDAYEALFAGLFEEEGLGEEAAKLETHCPAGRPA
jgi:glycosyltransferase involved in cell wall biosynthesis